MGNADWSRRQCGAAITGFVNGALAKTDGAQPDVQAWYAVFLKSVVLPNAQLWSYLVTFGEVLVGIACILALFTGIAAFFGSIMNLNYLLAGTVSTNPVLFVIATLLVLAWKYCGLVGPRPLGVACLGYPLASGDHLQKTGVEASEPSLSPAAISARIWQHGL